MEKSNKEKGIEKVEHLGNTLRSAFHGIIPGGQVIDGFLNYRSNLKRQRLQNFSEDVQRVFENELDFDLSTYNFETEDFVDVLESILLKVTQTKSELKLIKFRNILAKQIVSPIDNLVVNNYVRLVSELNEIELVLLNRIPKLDKRFSNGISEKHLLHFITEIDINKANDALNHGFTIKIGLQDVFVNGRDLSFYINNLVSKGLLDRMQTGTKRIGDISGKNGLERQYLVTDAGIDFLQFIELYEPYEGT